MVDFAEQICLAVDQIVTERLRGINYDTTIIATIVDDSEAKNYKYTCSNGSAQFVAYSSDTTFKVDDSVQVTIPNNDYGAQKVIVGKYVKDNDATPYVVSNPFENLVDITHNLIEAENITASLLANDSYDQINGLRKNYEVLLWNKDFETGLAGYNRLGLKGDFQSHIAALKPISGNYGYRLEILSDENDVVAHNNLFAEWATVYAAIINDETYSFTELLNKTPDDWINNVPKLKGTDGNEFSVTREIILKYLESSKAQDKEVKKSIVYALLYYNGKISEIYLDSAADMYGNPYNFQTFFNQEKVFDVSSLGNIYAMSLYFYETSGSFLNEKGEPLPYMTPSGLGKLPHNLKTQAPYACLGYDVQDFALEDDKCFLFTLDGPTYNINDQTPAERNRKTLGLRWLHKFENGEIKVVESLDQVPEVGEVFWYRYLLGAPRADQYSGVYWKKIEEYQDQSPNNYISKDDPFTCVFTPEVNKATEQIKAIIVYNGKAITSNILTFTNEREVASFATSELVAGLSIWCNDNSYGNYFLYGQNNNLIDETKEHEVRFMSARFSENSIAVNPLDDISEISAELKEAKSITWEFPLDNTMITVHGLNYSVARDQSSWTIAGDPQGKRYRLDGSFTEEDDPTIEIKNNKIYITRQCREDGSIYNLQPYRINKTYNSTSILNTVRCSILKDGLYYVASKEFSFGLMGTNGTDATLVIDFDDNKTALIADRTITQNNKVVGLLNDDLHLTARLYDRNHQEVDFHNTELNLSCKWEWHEASQGVNWPNESASSKHISITTEEFNKCRLSHGDDLDLMGDIVYFPIVKVTVTGYGDYSLVAYKPIPIKKDCRFRYLIGPTEVVYDCYGSVDYYKGPYELYWCPDINGINIVQDAVASQEGVVPYRSTKDKCMVFGSAGPGRKVDKAEYKFFGTIATVTRNEGLTTEYNEHHLKPSPIYVKDVAQYGIKYYDHYNTKDSQVLWVQPILVTQNTYPSSTINQWDGKSIEIDENKGTIVAPAIAAGRKDQNNTFSGVMLGDWNTVEGFPNPPGEGDNTSCAFAGTGIYGFHQGQLSYGFLETGKAFIGKSGYGRILFNGDKGEIASSAWYTATPQGMFIDLNKGIQKMQRLSQYIPIINPSDYNSTFANGVSDKYYVKSDEDYVAVGKDASYSETTTYYIDGYVETSAVTEDNFRDVQNLCAKYETYMVNENEGDSALEGQYYTLNYIPVSQSANLNAKIKLQNGYVVFDRSHFFIKDSTEWSNTIIEDETYSAEAFYQLSPVPKNEASSITITKESYDWQGQGCLTELQTITLVETIDVNIDVKDDPSLDTGGGKQIAPQADDISTENSDSAKETKNSIGVEYRVKKYDRTRTSTYTRITNLPSNRIIDQQSDQLYVSEYTKTSVVDSGKYYFTPSESHTGLIDMTKITDNPPTYASTYTPYVKYYVPGYEVWDHANYSSFWNKQGYDNTTYYIKNGAEDNYTPCTLEPGSPELAFTQLYFTTGANYDRYITLSADEAKTPLSIGVSPDIGSRDFRVDWDGSVYINNGYFNGTIYAAAGNIGGWEIKPGSLVGGTSANRIELNSEFGFISGGTLKSPTGEIKLDGYFTVVNGGGYIGALQMNTGSALDASSSGVGVAMANSCVKATTHNAGLAFGEGYLTIMSDVWHGYNPTKVVLDLIGGGLTMSQGAVTLRMDKAGALTFGTDSLYLKQNSGGYVMLSDKAHLVGKTTVYIASQGGNLALNSQGGGSVTVAGSMDFKVQMTGGDVHLQAGKNLVVQTTNVQVTETTFTLKSNVTFTLGNNTIKDSDVNLCGGKLTIAEGAVTLCGGALTASSGKLSSNVGASNQEGIYARFG